MQDIKALWFAAKGLFVFCIAQLKTNQLISEKRLRSDCKSSSTGINLTTPSIVLKCNKISHK
jgi:hypothetical protein